MAERFETMDITEAALLHIWGETLIEASLSNSDRVVFIFRNTDGKAADAIKKHRFEGVAVNSLHFAQGLTWAKDRLFEVRRSAQGREHGRRLVASAGDVYSR